MAELIVSVTSSISDTPITLTSVVLAYNMAGDQSSLPGSLPPNAWIGAGIAIVSLLLIVWAIKKSNTDSAEMKEIHASLEGGDTAAH